MNSIAGVLALVIGLWFFGRDGKMASYAAMLLACCLSQWLGGSLVAALRRVSR